MKTVAITGVTGTLGSAVADRFAGTPWDVRGCARLSDGTYDGRWPYPVDKVNVTDALAVRSWLDGMKADALVTCAGVSDVAGIEEQDPSAWREVLDVNLTGTWTCIKEAVAHGATRIVTVASIHGGTPTSYPNRAAYTASKAGVVGLTRALAVELAPQGIAVNCVAPGHLPALMPGTASGQELLDAAASRTPAGRLVTPEEVADVIYWLCSNAPVTMIGQVLTISGGYELNTWPM